jgi:hypothetical protein
MEADEVLPDPEEPIPAEVVHESGRTRITRLVLPGGPVIRKEPLGPDGERRIRHEVATLERLRGVPGVVQLAGPPRFPGSVVLGRGVMHRDIAPANIVLSARGGAVPGGFRVGGLGG